MLEGEGKRKTDGITFDRVSLGSIALAATIVGTFYILDRGDNKEFQKDIKNLVSGLLITQVKTLARVEGNDEKIEDITKVLKQNSKDINKTHMSFSKFCEISKIYWPEHDGDCN